MKNSNDEIIATESHVGNIIMPEDTVPITVSVYMSMADAMEIGDIQFNIKNKKTNMYIDESKNTPKTTDFEIINVSERCSSNSTKITGEIQNNFKRDVEQVNLTVIFRNDDKIVYFEDT